MLTGQMRRLLLTLSIGIIAIALGMLCNRLLCYPRAFSSFPHKPFFAMPSATISSSAGPKPVIVVGSGLAGLAAAHEALKSGVPVRMLERAAKPGGNSIKASSGINGANTRFQRRLGIEHDDLFLGDTIASAGKRFNDWKAHGQRAAVVNREQLIARLTNESAPAVEWLTDEIGVDLSVVAPLGGHSFARTHRGSGKMPPGAAIVTTLLKQLEQNPHFELTTSAEVKSLEVLDGQVRGVHFRHHEMESTLEGPVVFAVGGFAGDAQGLLAKYRPDLAGMPSTNEARPASHGILSSIGAELIDMDSVQIHPTGFIDPADPTSRYKFLAAEMLRGEGGILLAPDGRRFVDELQTREAISHAIMELPGAAKEGSDVRQWDIRIVLDPGACEAAGSHLGFYIFKGLMEKIKVRDLSPEVVGTLQKYARAVASSSEDEFGRKGFGHWQLQPGEAMLEEEVCIGRVTPIIHFTMGGVAFNNKAEILRMDDEKPVPIPGVWAAGEITGGLHGDNRLGGSSLLECVVFGREAGRQAARHLQGFL